MTTSTRLAAHRAAVSAQADCPTEEDDLIEETDAPEGAKPKKKDKPMADATTITPEAHQAAVTTAATEATAAANGRMQTVFAAEEVKGKEALAASILADADYASLSADAIIKLVGKSTAETAASGDDTDPAFRDAALAAMDGAVEDLGTGGNPPDTSANNHGWNEIHAKIRDRRG